MEKSVIIVAGGSGSRMNSEIPKQFMKLAGKPVLMHTIERFNEYLPGIRIRVVLPGEHIQLWKELCSEYHFTIRHDIGSGGETRFHSVQRNLSDVTENSLVAIHDGVRPLVSLATIERCFATASIHGNAVPCIEIPETMRKTENTGTRQVDRGLYRLIQTPQVFAGNILMEGYRQTYNKQFTDDAGVIEKIGHTIQLVEGNPENIKITFAKDLVVAEAFLRSMRQG
ncbi:MAG TPA: 2-C-methyl-D-erythritol 4-phosphate cytidylyltransferase [Bacteroidales bacterium]|nr:2-C-methyl-D-erythritol 4-phosphate cytidylyltransferase [Bacteroidales bacterium]